MSLTGADVREIFEAVLPEAALREAMMAAKLQQREHKLDALALLRTTILAAASGSGGRQADVLKAYSRSGAPKVVREALAVLLWALGFVPKLARPEELADVQKLVSIIRGKGPKKLRAEAKLRPVKELLDFADLMYRYHWAVRDAELKGRPAPARLNPDVLMEWDHAARCLVGDSGQKWDDITLDT